MPGVTARMLTDKVLQALKPAKKPYKRSDARGLYVSVQPSGALWWRFKYGYEGREQGLSLGTYPDVTLKRAREKRDEYRRLLDRGINPSDKRKAEKRAHGNTFGSLANEWLKLQRDRLARGQRARATVEKADWILNEQLAKLKNRPITSITARDVLAELRKLEAAGKHETARRARQRASEVFRYAISIGCAERDPVADLRGALAPVVTKHRAAITEPREIGQLLRAIDSYSGQPTVVAALRLAPLVFVRPWELRGAEWSEIDLDRAEWLIPAERMKMKREHVVPLSKQAAATFDALREITGRQRLVFPALTWNDRPISENSVTAALRRMGYSGDQMTWHGFRTVASTLLHELGFPHDVVELQLSHVVGNAVSRAYNRAERLDERRAMMQRWSRPPRRAQVGGKRHSVPRSPIGLIEHQEFLRLQALTFERVLELEPGHQRVVAGARSGHCLLTLSRTGRKPA